MSDLYLSSRGPWGGFKELRLALTPVSICADNGRQFRTQREVTSTLENNHFLSATHSAHCSLFLPRVFSPSENNKSIPSVVQKEYISPSYATTVLSVCYWFKASWCLAGVGEGVQLRSVQGSGVRGSAPKIDGYLEGKKGFSSSYQILLRGPSYFFLLASRKKNENSKLHFLWSEMIRPAAKLIL